MKYIYTVSLIIPTATGHTFNCYSGIIHASTLSHFWKQLKAKYGETMRIDYIFTL